MDNPIKMDDLGVPLFLETPKYSSVHQPKKMVGIHGDRVSSPTVFDVEESCPTTFLLRQPGNQKT